MFVSEVEISRLKYTRGVEIERSRKKYLLKLVNDVEIDRILDVGCGAGINSSKLLSSKNIVGVDISPEAIELYKKNGFRGKVADLSKGLPFPDNYFDAILFSEVLEHISSTSQALNELNRILRPGGLLFLSTPNSAFWVYRIFALLGHTLSDVQHPGHVRFFSKNSLSKSLSLSNFKILQCSGRNIFMILPDKFGKICSKIFGWLGFHHEVRFKTNRGFGHLSCFSANASEMFTDTFILVAQKIDKE